MPEATAAKKRKVFTPNWDAIMKILGDPKQEAIYTNRSLDPATMDGAWDFQAMQKGLGMRRVAADVGESATEVQVPSGFVFVCECGYARRVIDSEHSFTCERPNASGPSGCGIIWNVEVEDSDMVNPKNGNLMKRPILEERSAIGKMARKYMMPKIKGQYIADMMRDTALARIATKTPQAHEYQPQTFGKQEKAEPSRSRDPFVIPEAPKPSIGGDE